MSVSLLTVWRAARARAVPFTGESAGYLVLLACEEQTFAPRGVDLSNVGLDEAGSVQLRGREPSDDARAERELRQLLAQLLEVASSPGLALVRAANRPCCGSLAAFGAELTKALIPFNRAAARRALNRLYRETERAEASGKLALEASPAAPAAPAPASGPVTTPKPAPAPAAPPEPSPVSPLAVVATPLPLPVSLAFVSALPPPVLPALSFHEVVVSSPRPPPVIERRVPANEPDARAPREAEHLTGSHAAAAPGADWPTRPETLVARRRAGVAREREWTERLPTPPRVPPRVAEVAPVAEVARVAEVAPVAEVERPPETPPLGSLAYSAFSAREPLAFEAVSDEPTERSPAVCEPESASSHGSDGMEWPVELADRSNAIPLEPERDALPPIPEPEPYPGMAGEKSDVRSLLSGFQVEGALAENDLRGELKRFLGIDETPRPSTLRRR